MREIKHVRQEPGGGSRRWFESDGLDLVVWQESAGAIVGFQLCYDLGRGEHALTWRAGSGFMHTVVDAGDESPLKNESPILLPTGKIPWDEVGRLFEARAEKLEPALRELVSARLSEGRSGQPPAALRK